MLRTFLYFVCLVPVLFDESYAFKFSLISQKHVLFPRTRLLQRLSFTNPLIPRRTVMSSSDRETETGKYLFHHCSRRSALISGFVFASMPTVVRSEGDSKLYKGPSAYGFEFRYPTGWLPNKKIGNRHLYDLEVRSPDSLSTISVTIDQISSNTLEQWSSLDEAAERLRAQYEKQGDGRTAAIKSKRSEKDSSGLTFYTFEVALDNGALFLVKLTTTAQVEARPSVVSPHRHLTPGRRSCSLCSPWPSRHRLKARTRRRRRSPAATASGPGRSDPSGAEHPRPSLPTPFCSPPAPLPSFPPPFPPISSPLAPLPSQLGLGRGPPVQAASDSDTCSTRGGRSCRQAPIPARVYSPALQPSPAPQPSPAVKPSPAQWRAVVCRPVPGRPGAGRASARAAAGRPGLYPRGFVRPWYGGWARRREGGPGATRRGDFGRRLARYAEATRKATRRRLGRLLGRRLGW